MIVTHDQLSKAYKEAAGMIAGKEAVKDIQCFCMTEGKDVEEFINDVKEYLSDKENTDEFLILADIFGASPCNTSLMGFRGREYRIVTGVNLGMILEALFVLNSQELDKVAEHLVENGKEGIKKVYLQG